MKFNTFVQPMLLSEQSSPFDDDDYIFEFKFDGIRATLHASPKVVHVFTRRGNEITHIFPELQEIANIVDDKVIFDGEIVSFEHGMPSFSKLQKRNLLKDKSKIESMCREEPVAFVAFDCLYDKKDLRKLPLLDRKKMLSKYPDTETFVKTKYVAGKGKDLFQQVVKMGLEGIVAKKKASIYETGIRTKDWIKIKNFKKEIFIVGGFVENAHKASLLLGEYRGKRFHFVGKVSVMRDSPLYKKLKRCKTRKKSPFIDYDEEKAFYIDRKYSCEVVFIERTPNGHLRQPVFQKEIERNEK